MARRVRHVCRPPRPQPHRDDTPGLSGLPLRSRLTDREQAFPVPGAVEYAESRETLNGVRPRMNLDSWGGYLSNPVIGGTSPSVKPQLDFAQASGARGNFLCGGELLGSRFGRKAQDRFLLMAAGQAYNVEMGVSNDLFPTGREETPECQLTSVPNDATDTASSNRPESLSDTEKLALFMQFLGRCLRLARGTGYCAFTWRGRRTRRANACRGCGIGSERLVPGGRCPRLTGYVAGTGTRQPLLRVPRGC